MLFLLISQKLIIIMTYYALFKLIIMVLGAMYGQNNLRPNYETNLKIEDCRSKTKKAGAELIDFAQKIKLKS